MKKTTTPPFNIILLGDPASGKGTQAMKLVRRYKMHNLDMGKEVKKPENLKHYDYAKTTAIGKLTPTAVVRNIFKRTISTAPKSQGILFNGTPKMINEAKLVSRLLRENGRDQVFVIYLHISTPEMIRRIRKRIEYVDGKRIKRDDDNEKALENRKKYYATQISKSVEFFKSRYPAARISGMGGEAEVSARIRAAVEKFIKNSSNARRSH